MDEYTIKFYIKTNGREPAREYIESLDKKEQNKILKYINFLRMSKGYLEEPYSKHIVGKIRELRVGFGHNRYRIFYFGFVDKKIIILSAFLKKTNKTPPREIERALNYYNDVINNPQKYE
ncbi:MAG: type II toxin-antitoxin system RelE/ParE family toxin [Chryseobacterium sp.]